MEARKLVGWNVRRLRVAKRLTIEELADRADADASFVARLERGTVNVGIVLLERVGKALEATLTDLVAEPPAGAKPPAPLSAGRKPRQKRRGTR
jgi:transcriptional regulator with XRE-family HTH domain